MNIDLGEITTVIDGRPYAFHVFGEDYDAPNDPLNQYPYIFRFNDLHLLNDAELINFTITPSDDIINSSFRGINNDLFRGALRYGIYKIKASPQIKQFDLFISDYDDFRKLNRITGSDLRELILEINYKINIYLPEKAINIEDLYFNINANENEVQEWANSLAEEEYLIKIPETIPNRFGGGMKSVFAYRLNPKKREDVKRTLSILGLDSDKLNIFLSYNTNNKIQAGKIKKGLETDKIYLFLAHEDIDPTEQWEEVILKNLKSCQVFLALIVTPNFRESNWTDQEAGFAIASAIENKKYIISLFDAQVPHGFLNKYQGINISGKNEDQICKEVFEALQKIAIINKYLA
jgi:hypothetical protein